MLLKCAYEINLIYDFLLLIYAIQILSKVSVINLLKIGNFKLCPLELSNMLYLQSIASNFKLYWSWHWMIEDLNFSKTFLVSSSETSEQIYIFLLDNKSTSMAFHSIDIFKIFQDNCLILHKRIWWNFYLKYFIFFMKYFIFPYFVTFNSNNSSVCVFTLQICSSKMLQNLLNFM